MVHQLRRDPRRTQQAAEACAGVATEHGLSFWLAGSAILRGWAVVAEGDAAAGIGLLKQGLHDWQGTGSVTYRTYFLGILAQSLNQNGAAHESMELLNEALELAEKTGEGLYAAELHRLRGEVLLADGAADGRAEADFRQALAIARAQETRSLELRAALSLARLHQRRGEPSEARQVLAPAYNWFHEGFQTPDVDDAATLLAALS
jgi:predicted ATPase